MGGSEFTHPVVEFRRWLKASGLQMDLEFVLLSFGLDMKVQGLGHWAQDSLLGLRTPKCLHQSSLLHELLAEFPCWCYRES